MPAPDGPPVLDVDRVAGLRNLGAEVIADIASLWLETSPTTLGALRAALLSGDLEAVARHAHTLRGSAANIGGMAFAAACEVLEDAALAGKAADLLADLGAVEHEHARLAEAMASVSGRRG